LSDELVKNAAQSVTPVVFMLWGSQAQAKKTLIEQAASAAKHLVLLANHPSPLSALRRPVPFLGCDHFAQANAFLEECGGKAIDW